jgi:hypothetical protein
MHLNTLQLLQMFLDVTGNISNLCLDTTQTLLRLIFHARMICENIHMQLYIFLMCIVVYVVSVKRV